MLTTEQQINQLIDEIDEELKLENSFTRRLLLGGKLYLNMLKNRLSGENNVTNN